MLTGSGIIALCLLIGLAATLLVLVGLIGREVRTPPLCARCRFDLSGHEDARRGRFPVTCPECGLMIVHDAQITRSRRQRRRGPLRTGLAGAALSIGCMVTIAAATGGTLDVYRLVSTPRLFRMAEQGSAEAFAALTQRAADDALAPEYWARIAENAVDEVTAPPTADSNGRSMGAGRYTVFAQQPVSWCSLYPLVLRKGMIDRETAAGHAARMVSLELALPPDLREGEAMPFKVSGTFRRDRSGHSYSSDHGVDARVVVVRLNGQSLLPPESELPAARDVRDYNGTDASISGGWIWEGSEGLPVLDGTKPGRNTVEVTVRLTSQFSIGGGDALLTHLANANSPLPWLDVTVSRDVEVAPSDAPPAYATVPAWNPDTGVESSLSRKCDCGRAPGVRLRLSGKDGTHADAVAFVDVYVAVGDNEPWYLGNKRIRVGDSWSEVMLTDEQADAIDQHGPATLRIVPTPWNADLYFDRPALVVSGGDITRAVMFEDESEDPDEN